MFPKRELGVRESGDEWSRYLNPRYSWIQDMLFVLSHLEVTLDIIQPNFTLYLNKYIMSMLLFIKSILPARGYAKHFIYII